MDSIEVNSYYYLVPGDQDGQFKLDGPFSPGEPVLPTTSGYRVSGYDLRTLEIYRDLLEAQRQVEFHQDRLRFLIADRPMIDYGGRS